MTRRPVSRQGMLGRSARNSSLREFAATPMISRGRSTASGRIGPCPRRLCQTRRLADVAGGIQDVADALVIRAAHRSTDSARMARSRLSRPRSRRRQRHGRVALRARETCGSGRTASCLHRNQRAGRCRSRACPHHAPRSREGEPCWRDDERRSPSPARAWTQPAGAAARVLEQPTLHLAVTFPCHIQDDNGTRWPAEPCAPRRAGEPGVRDCGVPCANSGGSYLGSPSRFPPIARPNEGILVHRLRFRLL